MKHWKIYTLMALAMAMTVGLSSCKDDDEITVQEISVYKLATSTPELYNASGRRVRPARYTAAQKEMMEKVEKKAADAAKSIRPDTVTPQAAFPIFVENAKKMLNAFKDGVKELPDGFTIQLPVNLAGGASSPYAESTIEITNSGAKFIVEPRLAKVYYNMKVASVLGAEDLGTVNCLPPGEVDSVSLDVLLSPMELSDSISALYGWPKRDIVKEDAISAFDGDLPKAIARVQKMMSKECAPNLSDTVAVTIEYVLNYGEGAIIKNQAVKFTNKGYELVDNYMDE